MATTIYKLEPIELHKGSFGSADWNLTGVFFPDKLIVYIGVCGISDFEAIDWNNTNSCTDIQGDIVEIGSYVLGFDEDNNMFTFDNITFKVLNDSGIWENILGMGIKAEIKILYAKTTEYLDEELELILSVTPEFYGIISKKDIQHGDDVGPDDTKWGKYREYEFTAINYLANLKEVPISRLRGIIDTKGVDYFSDRYWIGGLQHQVIKSENNKPKVVTFRYITIQKLLKTILELIAPSVTTVTLKSDISFSNKDTSDLAWYVDTSKTNDENILIVYQRIIEGADYRELFFDDKDFTNNFSFYKYSNCLELFKEIVNSFGLTWNVGYTANETYNWKFSMTYSFMPRRQGTLKSSLNSEMHSGIRGSIQMEEVEGCSVSVVNYGDVTSSKLNINLYEGTSSIDEIPYSDGLLKRNTPFTSFCPENNKMPYDYLRQCFFGYRNGKIYPIDKYVVDYGNSAIETFQVSVSGDQNDQKHKRVFGKMLANYFGGMYGMFSVPRETLSFTVDTLDIKPLDRVPIGDKEYTVIQVEKNFLEGTSKLELRNY